MKILITMILTFISIVCLSKTKLEKDIEINQEQYAKNICLMKDKLLRGRKLQVCIKDELTKQQNSKLK